MPGGFQLATQLIRGTTMTNTDPIGSAEDKSSEPKSWGNIHKLGRAGAALGQAESSENAMSSEDLDSLLQRLSENSIAELDRLIVELQTLRRKLTSDRDRIKRDIATYEGLTKQVMQVTEIITDSVKRLPGDISK